MKIQRLFYGAAFVLTGLSAVSCTTCEDPEPENRALTGRWTWQESYCGWGGKSTPTSAGHTQTIEFVPNGTVNFYQDGALTRSTTYRVATGTSILTNSRADLISYGPTGKERITQSYSISNNRLELRDEAFDACSAVYNKEDIIFCGTTN
ncbi:hypothetical protein LJY25_15350 [Hymenobacter sp. BT175]|uniref:hypothetical protein n=1 Tax=Hymenobacter translucens TaxID=2886507 RepID=UPI001D0E8733|nr:hypothetical protein [Hymenobacter translucens]MCC2547825.1 hypothetical protein [Hymenobacter translucens]